MATAWYDGYTALEEIGRKLQGLREVLAAYEFQRDHAGTKPIRAQQAATEIPHVKRLISEYETILAR